MTPICFLSTRGERVVLKQQVGAIRAANGASEGAEEFFLIVPLVLRGKVKRSVQILIKRSFIDPSPAGIIGVGSR